MSEHLHGKDYTVAEAVHVVRLRRDQPALSGFLTRRDLERAAGVLADHVAAGSRGPIDVRPGRARVELPDGTAYEVPVEPVTRPFQCDPAAGFHVTPHRGCTLR